MLSIIIPVYNEQEILVKRLSFLNEQANKFPIEIIVSISPETTDDSEIVCKQFDKVNVFKSPKKGRANQMNFGASKAIGKIVAFLHADLQLPKDFYQQITNAIKNGYKMGFFAYKFDINTTFLNVNSRLTTKDGIFAGGGDQCQFFTKELFDSLKGYDERYCIMEDFKMMDTIRKYKIPYTIIQSKAIVSARKYDNNSWLKVNFVNGYVFLMYKLGFSPKKLRKAYKGLLRESV